MARQRVGMQAGREDAFVPGGLLTRRRMAEAGDALIDRRRLLAKDLFHNNLNSCAPDPGTDRGPMSSSYSLTGPKILATIAVAVLAFLRWDAGAAFFLALLTASVTGLVDRRVSAVLGLLCLASCPLLLIADREAWLQRSSLVDYYAANAGLYDPSAAAEQTAVWAYYFLCIGVVAQIVRYTVMRKRHDSEKDKIS